MQPSVINSTSKLAVFCHWAGLRGNGKVLEHDATLQWKEFIETTHFAFLEELITILNNLEKEQRNSKGQNNTDF